LGVPLEKQRIHAGFGRRGKAKFEKVMAWKVRDSFRYETFGGSMESYAEAPAIYVLEDGAVLFGGVGYGTPELVIEYVEQSPEVAERTADEVIEAMGPV
jgi:hypothetical protein